MTDRTPLRIVSEPIEGVIVQSAAERLAQGFVEATTEHDFADLPTWLQDAFVDLSRTFQIWDRTTRGEQYP